MNDDEFFESANKIMQFIKEEKINNKEFFYCNERNIEECKTIYDTYLSIANYYHRDSYGKEQYAIEIVIDMIEPKMEEIRIGIFFYYYQKKDKENTDKYSGTLYKAIGFLKKGDYENAIKYSKTYHANRVLAIKHLLNNHELDYDDINHKEDYTKFQNHYNNGLYKIFLSDEYIFGDYKLDSDNEDIQKLSLLSHFFLITSSKHIYNTGDYIYQYISKNGIDRFLDNPVFFLSSSKFLNDPKEGKVLFDLIKNMDLPSYQDTVKELLNYQNPIYIRSFTSNEDTLPMWSLYTKGENNKPNGVSIGYPKGMFILEDTNMKYNVDNSEKVYNEINNGRHPHLYINQPNPEKETSVEYKKMYFSKVYYVKDDIFSIFDELFGKTKFSEFYKKEFKTCLKNVFNEIYSFSTDEYKVQKKNHEDDVLKEIDAKLRDNPIQIQVVNRKFGKYHDTYKEHLLVQLYNALLPILYTIKYDDYKYENEYRLLYFPKDGYKDDEVLQDNDVYYVQSDIISKGSHSKSIPIWKQLKVITSPNMSDSDFEKLKYKFLRSKYPQLFDKERFVKSKVEFQ